MAIFVERKTRLVHRLDKNIRSRSGSKMRGRRNKLARKRRIWGAALLFCAVFLTVLVFSFGYFYRDALFAFGLNGTETAPPDAELPPTGVGVEPGLPGEPEPPEPAGPGQPSPYPPPPGQILQIADGDYLLALVTKQATLGSYAPADLGEIPTEMIHPDQRQWSYYLRQAAQEALLRMREAANREGVALVVISAYRSYDTQEWLYRGYVSRHGQVDADTFSARPGHSEHQLGTAVDFGGTAVDKMPAFGETPPGRWLAQNAHRYGFAMSYPQDSQAITGYVYEPWHFRYIGIENARRWKESGLVLCQYLENEEQFWAD